MDDTLGQRAQYTSCPQTRQRAPSAGAPFRTLLFLGVATALVACSQPTPLTPAERGRRVYLANCITCHNPDPTRAGASGPELAGAPRELLEARVLHGTYPPGYTPKRTTATMLALPQLADRIDDLAAFLAARQR